MVLAECYICNSSNNSQFASIKDDITNEIFEIVQCDCGFCYVNPRPKEDDMTNYYDLSTYHPHSKGSGLLYFIYRIVRVITFRNKYRLIKSYKTNQIMHLDYGSGDGSFSKYLNTKNNISSSSYDLYYEGSDYVKLNDGHYNAITLWHVLEHAYDLDLLFNHLDKLLTKSGILFIAVPNINALERKIYKDKWAAYDVPRHLYHFSSETLLQLLDKKGYNVISKKRMLFDTFYISLLSSMKISKFSMIKSLFNSCLVIMKILIHGPEHSSSLLYVCERKK